MAPRKNTKRATDGKLYTRRRLPSGRWAYSAAPPVQILGSFRAGESISPFDFGGPGVGELRDKQVSLEKTVGEIRHAPIDVKESLVEAYTRRLSGIADQARGALNLNEEFWSRFMPAPANKEGGGDCAAPMPVGAYGLQQQIEHLEILVDALMHQAGKLRQIA